MAIVQLLKTVDDKILSVHRLRQIFKSTGLYRRKNEPDSLEVASFLTDQQEESFMDTSCSTQCHHACFSRYNGVEKMTPGFNYIVLPQRYIFFFYKDVSSQFKVALFHCATTMSCLKGASQLL